MLYIGIMSGTSLDGIDVALVEITSQTNIRLIAAQTYAFDVSLRTDLTHLLSSKAHSFKFIGEATQSLTLAYANAVNHLLTQQSIPTTDIAGIGCHGQTVWHAPDADTPFSIQLHNPALLATCTGINVIDDFRAKDLAHNGQGAPLVPPFHAALLMPYPEQVTQRIIVNIGGIANITVLPSIAHNRLSTDNELVGFDTGPGNTLLDSWCLQHTDQPYDADGKWAKTGTVLPDLLVRMCADPYFSAPYPKSSGREYFNQVWLKQFDVPQYLPADVQATLVALTAHSICSGIHQATPKEFNKNASVQWLICGGGVHNDMLMSALNTLAPDNVTVMPLEAIGIDSDALEAMAFAWLAYCFDTGLCANAPSVTGAKQQTILGSKTFA